jgi:hypothetical protein
MRAGEHFSFVVWAVLPPVLAERTSEAALKKVGRRIVASEAFASAVLKKVILGFRMMACLEDHQIDCGLAKTVIESLIDDKEKARSNRREGGWE